MPKIGEVTRSKCKACGGTGLNSKGEPCYPCSVHGRSTVMISADGPVDQRALADIVEAAKRRLKRVVKTKPLEQT